MTQPTDIPRPAPQVLDVDLASLPLLASALDAAERNWPVIPLRPEGKPPAGHSEQRCPKSGRCASGHLKPEQRATTDEALIQATWAKGRWNVGIATGPAALVVVDLDVPKPDGTKTEGAPSGMASWQALCERAGNRPVTRQVRTPSGGEHWYFTAPPGARYGCTVGKLGPHIDTRAWGGYVVAPASTTPEGTYTLLDPDTPVAPLPPWLAALLREPSRPARPVSAPRNGSRAATVALERECATVMGTGEGARNRTLYQCAAKVARFVAWGDLAPSVFEEAFQGAGEAAGLPAAECVATIRSALNWSLHNAKPREAL
ncbi:DNA primase [Streptomyces sp. CB02959]|uniref:bifunctional DNA primase/polymerase n=1 Tax=Streptomyces sp. CB02959 TaxID=2020330 RepID=UPI000C2704DA|nr:bifunctional DNA primase/polymerase [Streptomyces sp. CB02959]PJN40768.1 DNA primase [Streptomyces sp. CB02959]